MPKFTEPCRAIKSCEGHTSSKLTEAESIISEEGVTHPPSRSLAPTLSAQTPGELSEDARCISLTAGRRQPGRGALHCAVRTEAPSWVLSSILTRVWPSCDRCISGQMGRFCVFDSLNGSLEVSELTAPKSLGRTQLFGWGT